jgi:hypothetical protein
MHEECMLVTSRVLHLVEMFLIVTISVATKCNHILFCGPLFSNSTSWIFQSIQVTLLVNVRRYTFCHKHIVPSVASGKSMKSRTPLICCSVVESLFFECELTDFEAVLGRFRQVSQLWITYSVASDFARCGLDSSWGNSGMSLVYSLKNKGQQISPKSRNHHKVIGA